MNTNNLRNFIIVILLFTQFISAQNYPQDFTQNPLTIKLNLNGSFGELRYNHFHSGMDFGTNKKIGEPIFAQVEGEVVRIHINEKGYGKALYIKHPNGFTTVYAHLNDYAGEIRKYVKENQYKEEQYLVELFPLKNELKVKKGDVIGYIGNTGSSAGPHLHYEIRDTQTEEIINPFLFGLDQLIQDVESPILNSLYVYPISSESVVNGEQLPLFLSLTKVENGKYVAENVLANGTIGFGVDTYDVMNNKYSKNGIYKLEAFLNGSKYFSVEFDRFSFDETRKINLYIDYERLNLTKERVQKLFKSVPYELNLIKFTKNDGKIQVNNGDSYNYKIIISDYHGNKTEIQIPISYSDSEPRIIKKDEHNLKKIDSKRDYILTEKNGTVSWDALTFYEDCKLDIQFSENEIKLHKDVIPLEKNMTVQFDLNNSNINPEKAFIGLVNGKSVSYFRTYRNNQTLTIKTKSLGTYKVIEDLVPPTIKPINVFEDTNFKENDVLIFEVADDLSGIKEIKAFINDKWALFEYEYKDKQIKHYLKDKIAQKGFNKVKIIVTDHVGNNVTFETDFQLN